MRVFLLIAFGAVSLAAQVPSWSTTTTLPNVDLNGLTSAQKQSALTLLREESCNCGCMRKLAQCRVEDTKCTVSRSLAAKAVKGIREGKSPAEIKTVMAAAGGAPPIFEEPVLLTTEGAPVKGPSGAKITLVEFSDFQCPYCAKAVLQLEAVQKAFPNDVKLIFKQFPLSELHPQAMLSAEAALAAHAQGKFWPLHDRMYANHTKLTRENILAWAKDIGCDVTRFQSDLDSAKTKAQIARDLAQGEEVGVEGTPTIFVNGKHYNGALDLEPFSDVLRQELKTIVTAKR